MDKICHRILSRFVDGFLDKRGNLLNVGLKRRD